MWSLSYLMELFGVSPSLGWLKGGIFHLCLSWLASFLNWPRENLTNEIMRFLNLRHSGTLLVSVSSPQLKSYSFSSYHLKANMLSSWIGKRMQLMLCILQSKGMIPQESRNFQNDLEKGFKIEMMEGRENGLTRKTWSWNDFLLYKDCTPFLLWDFWNSFLFPHATIMHEYLK
jgi:hypothetical protein